MAPKKKPTKKSTTKKTAAKKATTKKATAKKATPKKAAAKKAAAKKAPAKKAAATKAAAKKAPAKAAAKDSSTKKAAVKKPKSPFGQKFIDAQEKRLREEQAKYSESARTWKAEADSLLVDREPGDVQFDEESGDADTLQVERQRDLAYSSHSANMVEEIDEALKRIEAGVYGICVTSGKPIPKERLEAIPWAAERVEYKVAGFRR